MLIDAVRLPPDPSVVFLSPPKRGLMKTKKRITPWKRVLKHALGWSCILLGLIMLITPGQGLLTLLAGIFLLADEIPLFGRIKKRIQERFPRIVQAMEKRQSNNDAKAPSADAQNKADPPEPLK